MKPKKSAAQFEARQKAGLSIANPTHAYSGTINNANKDIEEKRHPNERRRSLTIKANDFDPNTNWRSGLCKIFALD